MNFSAIDATFLSQLSSSPWFIAAMALGVVGIVMTLAGIMALFRFRPLRFLLRTLAGALLISLGLTAGAIAVGIQGYSALTREQVVARIVVRSVGPQQFAAIVRYSDGREAIYSLAGDEIYIDAHILKWHSLANLLGLHTAYELDRIGGRYRDIEQEHKGARTLYALNRKKFVDLFDLRRRYALLAPLLDADYGSAAFVPVAEGGEFELRVTTTGLLIRPATGPLKKTDR